MIRHAANAKLWGSSFSVLILVFGFGLPTPANAIPIEVSQESAAEAGDFDSNVLGFIDPFNTGLTTAGF